MSSEDAAELEQLRREAAALRVQLQEVARRPVEPAAPAIVHQLEARIDSLAARNAKLMET
jgi:proteasome-associated ATPase